MNNGINLVVKRVDPKTKELQRRIKLLRLGAIGVLSIVTLISGILFVMIAASPLPRLREQEENIFTSLSALNSKLQRIIFVDKQLDHVGTILASRSDLPDVLREILGNTPETIEVISYTSNSDQMDITVEATRLSDIEAYLDTLTHLSEQKKIFQTIILNDLNISSSSNVYQFRISMTN